MADIAQDFLNGMGRQELTIEISVSNSCNKRCKYCFEQKSGCLDRKTGHYDEDRLLKLLVGKCEDVKNGQYSSLQISFWGGEPFLNEDLMERIVQYTSPYGFVRYHVYTNGTVTDRTLKFLQSESILKIKDRMSIQVSYDGEPHNSLQRGYGYSEIESVVDQLEKLGYEWGFKPTLSLDCVGHFSEMWDSFAKLHGKYPHIKFSPTIDTTKCTDERFDEFRRQLMRIAHREMSFYEENGDFLISWFTDRSKRTCNVNDHVFIDYDGNTYTCHGCPYLEDSDRFRGKNIAEIENLDECIGFGYDIHRPLECVQCEAKYCSVCFCTKIGTSDIKKNWGASATRDPTLCKYHKLIGKVINILDYAMITGNF